MLLDSGKEIEKADMYVPDEEDIGVVCEDKPDVHVVLAELAVPIPLAMPTNQVVPDTHDLPPVAPAETETKTPAETETKHRSQESDLSPNLLPPKRNGTKEQVTAHDLQGTSDMQNDPKPCTQGGCSINEAEDLALLCQEAPSRREEG